MTATQSLCCAAFCERRWKKQFNRVLLQHCPVLSVFPNSASQKTSTGTHTGVDFHSLISFCHFSVRLSVSQAVYCISVFVSKNGRSSSLPQKQLSFPCLQPGAAAVPDPSCAPGRAPRGSGQAGVTPRTGVSPGQGQCPQVLRVAVPWVCLGAKGSSCSRVPSGCLCCPCHPPG